MFGGALVIVALIMIGLPPAISQPLFLFITVLLIIVALLSLRPNNIVFTTARRLFSTGEGFAKGPLAFITTPLNRIRVATARSEPSAPAQYAFDPTAWATWKQALALFISLLLMYAGQYQVFKNGDQMDTSSGWVLLPMNTKANNRYR